MKKIISIVFIFLFLMPFAVAEGGQWSLLTARMIIRENMTHSPYLIMRSIGVKNTDTSPVDVTFHPRGDLFGITKIDETNITLNPNETRWVNFTVTLDKPGKYEGEIINIFSSQNGTRPKSALASEIIIIANDYLPKKTNNAVTISVLNNIVYIASLLAIGIIAISIFLKKR